MNLLLTVLFLFVSSLLVYFTLIGLGLDSSLASVVATVVCASIIYFVQEVKREGGVRKAFITKPKIVIMKFTDYTFDDPSVFLVFASVLIVFDIVVSYLSALFWGFMGWNEKALYISDPGILIHPPDFVLMETIVIYFLSSWAGVRTKHYPRPIVIAGIIVVSSFSLLANLVSNAPERLSELVGTKISGLDFFMASILVAILYIVVGVFGVYVGRNNQHAKYTKYLLDLGPVHVKNEIVQAAYDLARK